MTRLAVVGAIVVVLFGSGVAVLVATRDDRADDNATLEVLQENEGEVDYDYVIPAGTQDAKLRGELVEIMPSSLDVQVGESIRIRNDDDAGAMVGIFYVGAGEVVSTTGRSLQCRPEKAVSNHSTKAPHALAPSGTSAATMGPRSS